MTRSVAADTALHDGDLMEAACSEAALTQAIGYSQNGLGLYARTSLSKDRIVALTFRPQLPLIAAGQPLTIGMKLGPVEVVRSVTALQAARPGHSLFVMTADRQILKVAVPKATAQ